jgi:hypothetical protein
MFKQILAGAAVASALVFAGSASAATYKSYLEYWDPEGPGGATLVNPAFGYVLLEELGDGKTVKVTGVLSDEAVWQQSGKNNIFAFNLADDGTTVVTENYSDPNAVYDGVTKYEHAPWGTFEDFFQVQKDDGKAASGSNGRIYPFEFTAFNANGLTFAGTDADFGPGGKLTDTGDGNRFGSNAGGWWFMGHIQPDGSGSINIAARDAFCVANCVVVVETPVPEPGTWALMILGFGGAGAMLRQRRHGVAKVAA